MAQQFDTSQPNQPSTSGRPSSGSPLTRTLLWGCGLLFFASLIFTAGSGVGFAIGRMSNNAMAERFLPTTLARETTQENGEERRLNQQDMQIFWEAMGLLENDYYGDLPSPQQRSYGAIEGVLRLLEDDNTSFMTPQDARSFLESMDGSFEGIGATVEWNEELGAVRIVEPFQGQPAWDAGLRRNDLIVAVDGVPTREMGNLNEAITNIKGPRGSLVILTIVRGDAEAFDVEITRDLIEIPIVFDDTYGAQNEFAYIRLSRFSDGAARRMRDTLSTQLRNNPKGLILDLRGNPGGLLREAVQVSSIFLPRDSVVLLERFGDGSEEIYRAEGNPVVPADLSLVVLVDEGSASASEIVAGALQDSGRAVLIGGQTFGKGSVQLPRHLSDGSLLRITIASWYTPDNRSIEGAGLEPDILIEVTDEQIEADEDPALERAIQLLGGEQ
jgi:carboxyl-terminal processing protease